MGEGATGSLLAAVGTAMPEMVIPIVAIIGGAVAWNALRRRGEFSRWAVAAWAALYGAFIVAVAL